MRSLILSALCSLLSALSLSAQTTNVLKDKNNRLIDSLKVPSGKTLTIESGATINATGATITGFTTSAAWADITGKPTEFTPAAHNQAWSTITSTPTTLAGYGITDALTAATAASTYVSLTGSYSNPDWLSSIAWSKVLSTPTTLAGYGITDALTSATAASTYLALTGGTLNGGALITIPNTFFPTRTFQISSVGPVWRNVNGSGFDVGLSPSTPTAGRSVLFNPDGNLVSTADTATVTNTMIASGIALNKLAQTSATSGQVIAWNGTAWAPATASADLPLTGGTLTGALSFSGTTHAGLQLNNLTTTQRDALSGSAAGRVIWNTTTGRMNVHDGTAWSSGMVRLAGDTMTGQLQITQGTIASSAPLNITQTWNSGTPATGAFSMLTLNATLTNASSTSSGFLTCIRDGTTRIFFDSGGTSYFGGATAGASTLVIDTNNINISLRSSAHLDWMGDTKLYRLAAGVIAPRAANSTTGAAIEFLEQTAPSAPSADRVRVYAEDNGSGKTRLVVRWSDGTTTVLATQP